MESIAEARAGGGSFSGSRGSRSYSAPTRTPDRSSSMGQPSRQGQSSGQAPIQPAGSGFLRNVAGGLMGGFIGSLIFSKLGFAGQGGSAGGGGFGMMELLLLAGLAFAVYYFIKKKRVEANAYQGQQSGGVPLRESFGSGSVSNDLDSVSAIRQTDPRFSESKFNDNAMDIFFKIQAAWMNRDIVPVSVLLTEEMRGIFQGDINDLVKKGHINRLENIAVRYVEITESWQENGKDFITEIFSANLLDYIVDEKGAIVSGSKTEPVKFEEFWTFTRPSGTNPWNLSAISQA